MRLASLLPMLLLLASPLAAQQNCEIFDLTANVAQFSPNTCEFGVVLNFQHLGGTNQFLVKANGTIYGPYSYSDIPVNLGPFQASPTQPTVLNFIVQDVVLQDCSDDFSLTVPPCGNSGCSIDSLTVVPGNCHPLLGTYDVTINFQTTSTSTSQTFQVYTASGVSLGVFPLSALPLTLPIPWGGGPVDVLKICIDNQQNCCKVIDFQAPNCFNHPCGIVDLNVDIDHCTSDSTYLAKINFGLLGTINLPDSFQLSANGHFVGTFGVNQLPLPVQIVSDGGQTDIVRVCIVDSTGALCCQEKEFPVPDCLLPCAVHNLSVMTDSCSSDSTFGIWLNFAVTDSTQVDSFSLWGNTHYIGRFGLNQLPLHVSDFPWNGLIFSHILVCAGNLQACCKEFQFLAPHCLPFDSTCEITNLFTHVGDCTSDSTYRLLLNFNGTNPGNGTFIVYANGTVLDTFNLADLPLTIDSFPWNGGLHDVVTVCIGGNNAIGTVSNCCKLEEFDVPGCLLPCDIHDLHVETGDCNPAGGYGLTLNFGVDHPGNDFFDLYANGTLIGTFPLNQLPLHIPNFPGSGDSIDVIKVCINDHPNCCETLTFQAPDCNNQPCEIFNLHVDTGDCDSTGQFYALHLNFDVFHPSSDSFDVYAGGMLLGTFPLNSLPLHIPNFPASGNNHDVIKVCIHGNNNDCCKILEFQAPDCNGQPCEIYDLHVDTGDCNPAGGYGLTLNFGVHNPGNNLFDLYANGVLIGTFPLNQLPLHIPNFPGSGDSIDVIKVCINDHPDCCKVIEFHAPNCNGQPCDISDLHVETGDCTGDSTYQLTINFNVTNPPGSVFGVWANGQFLGMYGLGQLPLTIQDFPWNGGPHDVVKVCIGGNNGALDCCATLEFDVPDCLTQGGNCDISDLVVDPGACTGDSTYNLVINFHVNNAPDSIFTVFANGVPFGTFNISQLPLVLHDFPWNGGPTDIVKVCFISQSGQALCCESKEFDVPDCLMQGGNCDITGMVVDPGACTSDSTYQLFLNFQVNNPPGNQFGVWANGVLLGTFNLNQLPLTFPNFPWNGGQFDVVKVCFVSSGAVSCCKTVEFPVPDCLGNNDCHIFDMVAVHTACLCGQFFVAINFSHQGGSAQGFDITGNGNNYGNFPYNTPQPIILGPFPGDGTTDYEFGIADHEHPDCHDAVDVGMVNCQTPVVEPGSSSSLVIAPNPASNWINVTAQLENGVEIGQATVKIYQADGKLIQTLTVGNAASFQLDISHYPAGVYRMSIMAGAGRLEGSFTKQF